MLNGTREGSGAFKNVLEFKSKSLFLDLKLVKRNDNTLFQPI